nr:hypothetical protein [Tanacetum cinerariifolium]
MVIYGWGCIDFGSSLLRLFLHQTLSATTLRQAAPKIGKKYSIVAAPEISKDTLHAEKVIIDMSGNTRVSTPPAEVNQPSPPREHHDTHVSLIHDVHSPQSSYYGNEDKLVANRTRQLVATKEKIGVLECEKLALSAQVAQADADHKKLIREFIPTVVKRLHTSVEYRKILVAPKVADSYDLSISELLAMCLDVPPPLVTKGTTSGVAVEDTAQQSPSSALKINSDTSFSTTI